VTGLLAFLTLTGISIELPPDPLERWMSELDRPLDLDLEFDGEQP
jgi:hypothetical protein